MVELYDQIKERREAQTDLEDLYHYLGDPPVPIFFKRLFNETRKKKEYYQQFDSFSMLILSVKELVIYHKIWNADLQKFE